MANSTMLSKINTEENCQLVSLTNKLPYYVKRLCKSNKHKATAALSKSSEYLRFSSQETMCVRRNRKYYFQLSTITYIITSSDSLSLSFVLLVDNLFSNFIY